MKRVAFAALSGFAAAVLVATMAFAESPPGRTEASGKSAQASDARPRYASTMERWRGRPRLPSATWRPVDATGSEKVYEHLPSVNFLLQGQSGGAFLPHL